MKTKLGLMAATAFLASCGSVPPKYDPPYPYDAEIAGDTSLALTTIVLPDKVRGRDMPIDYSGIADSAMNTYNPNISPEAGAAGGIIAMLIIAGIDAQIDSDRNNKINKFLAANDYDAAEVFQSALISELNKRGLQIDTNIYAEGDNAPDNAMTLNIFVDFYGYEITGAAGSWVPSTIIRVEARAADGETILMKDTIAYGRPGGIHQYVAPTSPYPGAGLTVEPVIAPYDPTHLFKNVDAFVKGDPELGLEAIDTALNRSATAVADLFIMPDPARNNGAS